MTEPGEREPAPYKPTLFDRQGPAGADTVRAASYGVMTFAIAISATLLVTHGLPLTLVVVFALCGLVVSSVSLVLSGAAGAGWQHIMASGSSTPYEAQFSYQDSLVMRGQVDEALASYEAMIREEASAVAPRLRAAALYASRGGNPRRAAELLREVQRLPGVAARDDIAASNRLAELLMGPLGESGRAMVELRRLMDRHPGTDAASRARLMLAELKETIASPPPARGESRP